MSGYNFLVRLDLLSQRAGFGEVDLAKIEVVHQWMDGWMDICPAAGVPQVYGPNKP